MFDEHRHRGEVIDGSIKKPLDLSRVEVDADDPFGAGAFEERADALLGGVRQNAMLTKAKAAGEGGRTRGGVGARGRLTPQERKTLGKHFRSIRNRKLLRELRKLCGLAGLDELMPQEGE